MNSIRTKITLLTVGAIIITLGIVTAISFLSIKNLGRNDADKMFNLTAKTGAMNLNSYFESVEHSTDTVASLVTDSFKGMPIEDLNARVENTRNLFGRIANNTNGVRTYYFRIDPNISKTVKGFWYVNEDGNGFKERAVTDITQYDTSDTSKLVWFTVPKEKGKSVWLPPYVTENLNVRVISYNVPVYWNNQFIGVIGIEIDYETLLSELKNIQIFDNGYAFILDEDFNLICHPQMDVANMNQENLTMNDSGRFVEDKHVHYVYQGVEKEAVWEPLSNGMRLYVSAPVSEIDGGWQNMIEGIILASIVIVIISSLVMVRFSDRITKPLRDLTEAAKQVQNDNFEFTLDYDKNDEVGILTQTFKQLANYTKENLTTARKMATVDSLTGIKNKYAYTKWEEEINEAIRNGKQEPFAVVVCDIDDLKTVNDLYGHKEGDSCIKNACMKICHVFSHSPVFRIGGDEFAVILTGKDYNQREELIEQINKSPTEYEKARVGETVSAGMAEYDQDHHTSILNVFEDADKAMYSVKHHRKESFSQVKNKTEGHSEYIAVMHDRKTILVADAVEINRKMMGNLLNDEYNILYASDGDQTLKILRECQGEIDLVLLELQMPGKNGREVIAEMQIDENLMSIPVIFLTVDQSAEVDCLKNGAMDFIPKPYPDIEIIKARIAKCIELSEDRDLIRYTERDRLTGLFNKDYFYRYVNRFDNLYKDDTMDAVVCDVNGFSSINKQYGRQFGDYVLHCIGNHIKKMARETGGIGCTQGDDTFLLYCPHQDHYEQLFRDFSSDIAADKNITDKITLRFGVFVNARRETDIEKRFDCAKTVADSIKDDPQKICGFYDLG